MIRSMTGFVSQSVEFEEGVLTWDVRSVNHRFLDLSLRLPEMLRSMESQYREQVKAHLKRGKVDIALKWQSNSERNSMEINELALKSLAQQCQQVAGVLKSTSVNALDALRWPGVLEKAGGDIELVQQTSMQLLGQSLETLVEQRGREGATVKAFILNTVDQIRVQRQSVIDRMPVFLDAQRAQLMQRLESLSVNLDPNRLEQEVVLLVQKSDVAEEIQRLGVHLDETVSVVTGGGVVGRRLDFLMQELNREVNTTASKSADTDVTKAAIEMKVLVEQIREQVQNIE